MIWRLVQLEHILWVLVPVPVCHKVLFQTWSIHSYRNISYNPILELQVDHFDNLHKLKSLWVFLTLYWIITYTIDFVICFLKIWTQWSLWLHTSAPPHLVPCYYCKINLCKLIAVTDQIKMLQHILNMVEIALSVHPIIPWPLL